MIAECHLIEKHTHKTRYRVTQTPFITGGELRCSGRVSSYKPDDKS